MLWSPVTDSLQSVPYAQDWMLAAPTWDDAHGRLLLTSPKGLLEWKPGSTTTPVLVPGSSLGGFCLAGDRLVVTRHEGTIQGFPLEHPTRALWTTKITGRVDAAPLPLDLDGDGTPDRFLVVTNRARAVLLDEGGRLLADQALLAPVRYAPIPLARDPRGSKLPVLVAGQDGRLLPWTQASTRSRSRSAVALRRSTPCCAWSWSRGSGDPCFG